MSAREVKAIRAHVNLYRLRVEILLRSYEMNEARIILADRQRNGNPAAKAARDLRVYWNIPPGPIRNLTELVESHGILVIPIDFDNSGFDGLSIYEPNDILPPMIFLNRHVPSDRWRLSLRATMSWRASTWYYIITRTRVTYAENLTLHLRGATTEGDRRSFWHRGVRGTGVPPRNSGRRTGSDVELR